MFAQEENELNRETALCLAGWVAIATFKDIVQGANPYVIIKCEKRKVRSPTQHGTVNPVFNTQAVFYRRNVQNPIIVQVWHSDIMCDQFLGQVLMTASPSDPKELQRLRLQGRGRRKAEEMPGHITVQVLSSDDLAEL